MRHEQYCVDQLQCSILLVGRYFKTRLDDITMIVTEDPRHAFAQVVSKFFERPCFIQGIATSAYIDDRSRVGKGTRIGENVFIGPDCRIGNHVTIYPNVSIYDGVEIRDHVIIHAGAVIGGEGFGYTRDAEGRPKRFPHVGGVTICEYAEIGANTTIDRGVIDHTVIGSGTKIDNLCQIAYNVRVGKDCLIAANACISGSVVIGDNAWIGPSAVVGDAINIERGAFVGIGACVIKNVMADSMPVGYSRMIPREFRPKDKETCLTLRPHGSGYSDLKGAYTVSRDNAMAAHQHEKSGTIRLSRTSLSVVTAP